MDQPRLKTIVDLLAQAVDVHIDDVTARLEIVCPCGFQEHRAGHDLAGMTQQLFQEQILAALQVDDAAAPGRSARLGVDRKSVV